MQRAPDKEENKGHRGFEFVPCRYVVSSGHLSLCWVEAAPIFVRGRPGELLPSCVVEQCTVLALGRLLHYRAPHDCIGLTEDSYHFVWRVL